MCLRKIEFEVNLKKLNKVDVPSVRLQLLITKNIICHANLYTKLRISYNLSYVFI